MHSVNGSHFVEEGNVHHNNEHIQEDPVSYYTQVINMLNQKIKDCIKILNVTQLQFLVDNFEDFFDHGLRFFSHNDIRTGMTRITLKLSFNLTIPKNMLANQAFSKLEIK